MKTLRDKSVFNGCKELDDLLFFSNGTFWNVSHKKNNAWYYVMTIPKVRKETHTALYERATDMIFKRRDV